MPHPISVVTGNYPHTTRLKSTPSFAGASAEFPHIDPVHDAFDDMVRLDLLYAKAWSPWVDLQILLRTPKAVIEGAH